MQINQILDNLFEAESKLPKELYYYSNIIDKRNTTFCYSATDLYYIGDAGLYTHEVMGSIDIEDCTFFKVENCCGGDDYFMVFKKNNSISLQQAIDLDWDI